MMEQNDRYFFLSLASLAVSLFFFPLALYILPQAFFGWAYHTPDFILNMNEYFQGLFGITLEAATSVVFYCLFFLALIFAGIAYFAATHTRHDLKKTLTHETVDERQVRLKQAKQNRRQMIFLVIKIILILMLVFFVAEIVQWAISISPE